MPRYFLHVTQGDEFIPDPEGIERDDVAAAEKAAVEGAGGLIVEAVKRGERDYSGRFDVEDEHGATVLTLTFACPVRIEVRRPL